MVKHRISCIKCEIPEERINDQKNKNKLLASKFNCRPDILFGTNGENAFADNPLCKIWNNWYIRNQITSQIWDIILRISG